MDKSWSGKPTANTKIKVTENHDSGEFCKETPAFTDNVNSGTGNSGLTLLLALKCFSGHRNSDLYLKCTRSSCLL